jgi:hypothetical protein
LSVLPLALAEAAVAVAAQRCCSFARCSAIAFASTLPLVPGVLPGFGADASPSAGGW